MTNTIAERLRTQCANLRTKPVPLADLIPLLQEAANELDALDILREVIGHFCNPGALMEAHSIAMQGHMAGTRDWAHVVIRELSKGVPR